MFKKLLTIAAVFFLISCQNLLKKGEDKNVENPAVTENTENQSEQTEPYQVLEGEEQAKEMNAKTEEAIEEVEVQDRVFFKYDSSDLSDDSKKILETQIAWLKSDATIKVTIEGHCDERGTREYNIALGERRANSAKTYLTANGIDQSRIAVISYGKERAAFFGNTEGIFAKNRRAVTVIDQ